MKPKRNDNRKSNLYEKAKSPTAASKINIEEQLQNWRSSVSSNNTPIRKGGQSYVTKNLRNELDLYKKDINKVDVIKSNIRDVSPLGIYHKDDNRGAACNFE